MGLAEARGRVLAEDVVAPIDVPPFDRATMDGYAVRAEDAFGASDTSPVELKVVGESLPGRAPTARVGPGEAVRIATGAPMPDGANAVVPVEYTREGEGAVYVLRAHPPGANVMARGADIRAGTVVLKRGSRLGPRELGVLSALGFTRVKVYARPRVAVISTGDELVPPGSPLRPYSTYDVNWITLLSSAEGCGCTAEFLGAVGDDPAQLEEKLRLAVERYDAAVVSGGSSVGAGDLMRRVVPRLGEPGILVDGVRVKPGKPTIVASVGGKPLFCLPGYPTSALIAFSVFAAPILRAMAGLPPKPREKVVNAKVPVRLRPAPGRTTFFAVKLERRGKELVAVPILKGSGAITTLALADGYVVVDEHVEVLPEGSTVQVHLFEGVEPWF